MYRITEECDRCGMCLIECALDAIVRGETIHRIAPEKCTSCAACVAACPLGVIVQDDALPRAVQSARWR